MKPDLLVRCPRCSGIAGVDTRGRITAHHYYPHGYAGPIVWCSHRGLVSGDEVRAWAGLLSDGLRRQRAETRIQRDGSSVTTPIPVEERERRAREVLDYAEAILRALPEEARRG